MRGQFFSLDVFVAAIILVSGSLVLLFSISATNEIQEAQLFSADILRETITKSLRELNYEVLTNPTTGFADPNDPYDIKDYDMTLGELIGEYHHLANASSDPDERANYTYRRDVITQQTIAPLISDQYNYRINLVTVSGTITSRTTIVSRERLSYERAEYRVSMRSIVAGVDRNREFFGPITIEVVVWN